MTEVQISELKDLFPSYHDVFAQDGIPPPAMKDEPLQISLLPRAERKLRQDREFRLGKTDPVLVKHRVNEWLRMGVVRPGSEGRGPLHSSPAFVAPKKEKVLGRTVIDFRGINALMVKHSGGEIWIIFPI